MPQQKLISDDFLADIPPNIQYVKTEDVVSWRYCEDGFVVVELVKRPDSFYSIRYLAWVAWRDAGDIVRSRSWHIVDPGHAAIADDLEKVREIADETTNSLGLKYSGDWLKAT